MKRNLPWVAIAIICLILGFVFGTVWAIDSTRTSVFILGGLALGVVVGFVIDWLLEESYRRNRELERQLEMIRQQPSANVQPALTNTAEHRKLDLQTLVNYLYQKDEQIEQLRAQLDEIEANMVKRNSEFEAYMESHPDDLTAISGIGSVYQWKLRDIGINTFRKLAQADKDQLQRMLDIKSWQRVDLDSWISQAGDWASRAG